MFDLTGSKVQGEFRIDWEPQAHETKKRQPRLILRNAVVETVADGGENAWPDDLDLYGFTYASIGGMDFGDGINHITSREKTWFIDWLKKDTESFSQPYHQLAGVLKKTGHVQMAAEVLFAGKERERGHAKRLEWLGLSLLKWTIGYGFGHRYFYSLLWVAAITFIGAFVFSTTTDENFLNWLDLSFDLVLPLIELNKTHSALASKLTGWQQYYFHVHKLTGFILGSFVLAGLSGITKK